MTTAFARGLHKLMAYKDEYEVARLHLDSAQQAAVANEFGPGADTKVLLHPPVLKALGLKHKIHLGIAAGPVFRTLRATRHLRGTHSTHSVGPRCAGPSGRWSTNTAP